MVTKTLRPFRIDKTIAADNAIHPDVVVKVIAGHCIGDVVDVIKNRLSADLDYLGTSKTLPVKARFSSKISGKAGVHLAE